MRFQVQTASVLAATLTLASAAPAVEPPAAPLRLDAVLASAREANPEIRVAATRARAAESGPVRAGAWDDPVVSWEAWNTPDNLDVSRADNNIFRLAQRIPFPGKKGLAAAAARDEARALAHTAAAVALDVEAAVKRAFWTLWQAHERRAVYERQRILADRIERTAARRYAIDRAPQADVVRAQVEMTHAVTDAQVADLEIDTARAALNALLSRPPADPLGVPEAPRLSRPPPDAAGLVQAALGQRPELASQGAMLAGEQRALELARRAYLPDFELSVSRFVNYRAADGFGAMASVTVPIANKAKYDAGIAEAQARIAATRAEWRRLEDAVRRDVEIAWLRVRKARLMHDQQVGTHLPHARLALEVTESAYASGGVDLQALLDTMRALEAVHLEHVASAAEVEIAWADLERAVGGSLPAAAPASSEEHRHD